MTVEAFRHAHSSGLVGLLAGWVLHAAIWRFVYRLPTPLLVVVGAAALFLFVSRFRTRRSRW